MAENVSDTFREKLNSIIDIKKPIKLQCYKTNSNFLSQVEVTLSTILKSKNYQHLYTALYFVLREMIENGNKANVKRVFFKLKKLNIDNPEDYKIGMKTFSSEFRGNYGKYEEELIKSGLFINVIFQEYAALKFNVYIANSSLITDEEKKRINQKISHINKLRESGGDCDELLDETESAGLGLLLSLRLLEEAGIKNNALTIGVNKGMTVVKISFEYLNVTPPPYSALAKELLGEVDGLPNFPENITSLINKLKDENVVISEISEDISKDPALSADMLKIVNSARFMTTRKISSVKEAVNIVGLKGITNLLYSYAAIKIVNDRFGTIPEIWNHCNRTANIAAKLGEIMDFGIRSDEFFTAGMLHDIGKILLMGFDKEKAKKIEEVCEKKNINLPVLEEIMMGFSHARIGGMITKHWDFPEGLVDAISFHHDPIMASNNLELVYVIYLANYFANIKSKEKISIFAIESNVRSFFKLGSQDDLLTLVNKLELF